MLLVLGSHDRELQAVLYETFTGPAQHPIMISGRERGRLYHEATVGRQGQGLGPPAIQIWAEIVIAVTETEEIAQTPHGQVITNYANAVLGVPRDDT